MKIERYVIKDITGNLLAGRDKWVRPNMIMDAFFYRESPTTTQSEVGGTIHKVTIEVHEPEFLPCPFCGGTDLHMQRVGRISSAVACAPCQTNGPWCRSDAEARAAWNRRTS